MDAKHALFSMRTAEGDRLKMFITSDHALGVEVSDGEEHLLIAIPLPDVLRLRDALTNYLSRPLMPLG